MAFGDYKQHSKYHSAVDPARCLKGIWPSGRGAAGRTHQCRNKPSGDGTYCSQHTPEAIKKRRQAQIDRQNAAASARLKSYASYCKRGHLTGEQARALLEIVDGDQDRMTPRKNRYAYEAVIALRGIANGED